MKKRKLRVGRLIVAIIFIILLALSLGFVFKKLFFNDIEIKENIDINKDKEDKNNEIIKKEESLKIDLVKYETYISDISNFVIAEIRFKDEKTINFDLSQFKTSEGICLNDVDTKTLEDNGYYLWKKDVVYEIKSDSNSYICNLFIPFVKVNDKLDLLLDNKIILSFDLKQNIADINDLKVTTNTTISNEDKYEIYVRDALSTDMVKCNGEEYNLTSTQMYIFKLEIKNIKEGITLEKAEFLTSDNEVYEAKGKQFTSEKAGTNMIGASLKKDNTYGLFFEVFSPDSAPVSYKGKLRLKFSSDENWIELYTELD